MSTQLISNDIKLFFLQF